MSLVTLFSFESFSTTGGPNKILMILGDQSNLSSRFGVLGLLVELVVVVLERLDIREGPEVKALKGQGVWNWQ